MELAEVVNTQYAFPVGIVLICAVFVFAFGFKYSNPPTFSQLVHAADERKTAGKKKKLKDKKSAQNNISSPVANDEGRKQRLDNPSKVLVGKISKQMKNVKDEPEISPIASNKQKRKNVSQKENVNESVFVEEKAIIKDGKQSSEGKKIQSTKDPAGELKNKSQEKRLLKEKNYNIQQVKSKNTMDVKPKSSKSSKLKVNEEKPVDFDDGEWEQAISRKEKKSKKKDEEALMAAYALNSGSVTTPVKQTPVTSTLLHNISEDLSVNNTETYTFSHHDGTSIDISANNDELPGDTDIGEVEKQETTTKAANASASSSAPLEKPKSSKSKGKNKESSLSLQKEPQENESISAVSLQPQAEEITKSKKKKKQSNASDNKEGKTPAQSVEASQPLSVEMEVSSGHGDLSVAHDMIADTKIEQPQASVVFDELGDVWKEAKAPKKSKKKVRKDQ